MDRVHSTTKPAWALHAFEPILIFFVSIFASTAATTFFSTWIRVKLSPHLASGEITEAAVPWIVDIIITLILTTMGVVFLPAYRRFKTFRYPGTYMYCFKRHDKAQTASGHTEHYIVDVVGTFILRTLNDGGIVAKGTAFDWVDGRILENSHMSWSSENIGATMEGTDTTCYIIYKVDAEDRDKRSYEYGLLWFEKRPKDKGIVAQQAVYRGHIHGIDPPNGSSPFYAHTYAERIGRELSDKERLNTLRNFGAALIAEGSRRV